MGCGWEVPSLDLVGELCPDFVFRMKEAFGNKAYNEWSRLVAETHDAKVGMYQAAAMMYLYLEYVLAAKGLPVKEPVNFKFSSQLLRSDQDKVDRLKAAIRHEKERKDAAHAAATHAAAEATAARAAAAKNKDNRPPNLVT